MEDFREVSHLNRILKVNSEGNNIIGDPKHSDLLQKEWGIQEYSKQVYTPSLHELEDQAGTGEELVEDVAIKVRRRSARINFLSQDSPDLPAVAKVMLQHTSTPRERVVHILMCAPLQEVPGKSLTTNMIRWLGLTVTAGDANARRSTSGGPNT